MLRKRNGQSTLEYVIILTAIIAVIILAATSVIKPAMEKAMDNAAESIKTSTGKLPK